jgi:hypothetical protein
MSNNISSSSSSGNAMEIDSRSEDEATSASSSHPSSSSSSASRWKDRSKAFHAVAKNAADVWKTLPYEWKVDKQFILEALRKSPTLPSKSDFERIMPQSLRFDKDVVLAWCHRSDFEELYYARHLFVPDSCKGDKDVMMAYCQKIPRSLQECSEDLCNDRQVVEAAISLGGLELQYASLALQEDKPLVVQACQSHGRALEYCPPGQTRNELLHDRNFMYEVVLAKPGGGPMWKLVPHTKRKSDGELLLQALKHGLLLRDVPQEYWRLDFFKLALEGNAQLYMQLSRGWQQQFELALQAVVANDSTPQTHERALELCPSLRDHRQAVLAICMRGDVSFLKELLQDSQFCDDLEVMKTAISRDSKLFPTASPRLQEVPEIIMASITPVSAWNTLKTVPWAIQRQHPEIPITAIRQCLSRNLRYLPSHIPEELWSQHRDLCLAWIQRGGRVLEPFERTLHSDMDLALQVAKYNWPEFYKVGDSLLGNRSFMLQALEQDGRVLRFAASRLRQDFDLLITSVAHHPPRNASRTDSSDGSTSLYPASHNSSVHTTLGGICSIQDLHSQIQQQLDLHSSFVVDFLRGIAIATPHVPPARRCQLYMLDRGVETSQALKRLIGEYLGVPTGTQLRLLRQAKEQLDHAIVPSSSSSATASRRLVLMPTGAMEAPVPARWAAHQHHLRRRRQRIRRLRHHREFQRRVPRNVANGNNNNNNNDNDEASSSGDEFMSDSDREEDENHLLLQQHQQRLLQMGQEWELEMENML